MTLRLDGLHDIIVELEEKIEDGKISDEERKSLISSLIKETEIFPCDDS